MLAVSLIQYKCKRNQKHHRTGCSLYRTFKSNIHFHISIFVILVAIELVLVHFFSVITRLYQSWKFDIFVNNTLNLGTLPKYCMAKGIFAWGVHLKRCPPSREGSLNYWRFHFTSGRWLWEVYLNKQGVCYDGRSLLLGGVLWCV